MSKHFENIIKKFQRAYSARSHYYTYKKNCEELYYNDVEGTLTQFTKKQKAAIEATYNIEISTKIAYPIIEQALALLTASDPYPHLLSSEETTEDFTQAYTKAHHGSWYESRASYELINALREMMLTGHGFMRVRTNDFFNESTFNIIYEKLDWRSVIIDPESKKPDLTDAQFMFVVKVIRKERAEKEFDVDLSRYKIQNEFSSMQWYDHEDDFYGSLFYKENDSDDEPVLIKEFYEKVEVSLFVSENGDMSFKRPRPKKLLNPEKAAAEEQLTILLEEYESQAVNAKVPSSGPSATMDDEQFQVEMDGVQAEQEKKVADSATAPALLEEIEQLEALIATMPDMVDGYTMLTERGEQIDIYEMSKVKRKRIEYTLLVGDTQVEKKFLPGEHYPVIFFPFSHFNSPNRCFGMMHYLLDMQKALNRFWSMLLNEMQTNGLAKVIYPRGAITDPASVESKWAMPGAFIEYVPNPALQDGGRPEVVTPPGMNDTLRYLLESIVSTIEYVTGINSMLQGNPNPSQTTMGGTQALQNYGSQRLKLYAKQLERPLEILALVGVTYLQRYAPKDKVLKYFNKDGEVDVVSIMESAEDMQFKVRVDIGNSIATTRQMAHQLLATIAGQTQNPQVADMLTQHALEILDLPEGKRWAKEIEVIKNLQQQLQQTQQQLDELQKQNKSLENNYQQKQMANKVDSAVKDTEMDLERMAMDAENSGNEEEPELLNEIEV